jgi:16S rRNA (guanine1207-N2)-methyltransferase
MVLLDELPFVLPPDMARMYRAAWPSSDLLAEAAAALPPEARVLLLGCASDPLALAVAHRVPRGECLVADDDAAASDRLEQLSAKLRLATLRVLDPAALAINLRAAAPERFDIGLTNVMFHSSKSMTVHLLRLARSLLRPGATLYAAGAKERGMPSVAEEMRQLFGNVSMPIVRKGHRVAASVRQPEAPAESPHWPNPAVAGVEKVTVRGSMYSLATSPLVFAGGRLDLAAAMLAETLQVGPEETFVDLGCGSGIVGLVAARLAPRGHVYLLDASRAAVRTALVNAERNAIGNVTALAGDGPALMAGADLRPDVIATNPPFHSGQVEARQLASHFIHAAADRLRQSGKLYVVANRFLAYEPIASVAFEEVREVAGGERFKVLLAQGPRPER